MQATTDTKASERLGPIGLDGWNGQAPDLTEEKGDWFCCISFPVFFISALDIFVGIWEL